MRLIDGGRRGGGLRGGGSLGDLADRAVVRRARLRVCVIVGCTVATLVALVGGIAYAMLVQGQERQIWREVGYGAVLGDPDGPPGCLWIIVSDGGTMTTGRVPPPAGFPMLGTMRAVADSGATVLDQVERNGTVYFVRTQPRGDATVQVVFDARYQLADRSSLLRALLLAAVAGLLAAIIAGLLMGSQAVAPLAEALARQRRFVADASHELRTPIAQVHTRAQVLARRLRRGEVGNQLADLERLISTTGRLGEIVDELLLSARLGCDPRNRTTAELVDLAALAEASVVAASDRAGEHGVTVTLARPDPPLPVGGVGSALRRVVDELLANALAHTPAGGRIDVTVRRSDRSRVRAEIVVADTGVGFDPADADRLFDRFHHGTAGNGRRFGLGLALLREVVTGHGGTIEAISGPGQGATFTVGLPVAAAGEPAVGASHDHQLAGTDRPVTTG